MPREYLKGWSAAEREILRAREDRHSTLTHLARSSGVHGAAGLRYLVKLLRHHLGEGEVPECPSALRAADARFIQQRALAIVADEETR
jgi:hypothetical protein